MEKIEEGVMVVKDGLAWGISYADGYSTSHGWIPMIEAPLHDPRHCKKVTDVTYPTSPDISELKKGQLVKVRRTTKVEII